MKVALFSIRKYEQEQFEKANVALHDLKFFQERLTPHTVEAARGCKAVCCFANDQVNKEVILKFKEFGVKLIALRSAGYNHVDLEAAKAAEIPVVRVPNYSPNAVAEHAVALLLCLNRKVHRAFNRVREFNFSLEGLVGFDLNGKTVGVIGAGRIGKVFCQIMAGFGCKVLVFDKERDPSLEVIATYVELNRLLVESDIISLHVPLTPSTRHIVDQRAFDLMKSQVIIINTGRGALIDTRALIKSLKAKKIGGAGLDVYEEEEGVFFRDLSDRGVDDDQLARLLTFPNVLVTAHQAFLTREALREIVETTLTNLTNLEINHDLQHRVV
ncbi:MAG: 2-hydroxyacid dehydrogenase [Bdellovibrionales bacterium]